MDVLSPHSTSTGFEQIDLAKILHLLKAHWRTIVAVMIFCLIGTSVFLFFKLPQYNTTALIQIQNQNSSANSSLGAAGFDISSQASPARIEVTLINSNYILEPVIAEVGLDIHVSPKYFPLIGAYYAHHYTGNVPAPARFGLTNYAWGGEDIQVSFFNPPLDQRMQDYTVIAGAPGNYVLQDPSGKVILHGTVGQICYSDNGDTAILISTLAARPGTAFYLKKLYQSQVLENLYRQLSITELAPPSHADISSAMSDTGIIQLSMQSATPKKSLQTLNAIINLAVRQSSKQQSVQAQSLLDFIAQQLPLAKKNLLQAETALNQYQAKTGILNLTDQSSMLLNQIVKVDNEIAANEINQHSLLAIYTARDPIIQNLMATHRSLLAQKETLQTQLAALPIQGQQAVDLARDAKVQNTIYTLLLNRYQQMLLNKAAVTSNVNILLPAQTPDLPIPQYTSLILLASLLAGFIVASFSVLAWHFLHEGISDPYWIEKELGIRTLAIIPFSKAQAQAKKAFDGKKSKHLAILAKENPEEVSIESLRSLRTHLLLNLRDAKNNIIAIGGIIPQTGKSFVSVNLAVVLSESNKRVLLIDADMRRGYLNQYFGLSHSPGLSETLADVYPLDKVIRRTKIKNLDFISTGLFPTNPSELLLTERFTTLLAQVSAAYDLIVIDAPPILVANDASIIAQQAGTHYIIIPASQLKAHEIESAIRRFYNDGVKINGSLFNFAKKSQQQTSSYAQSYARYAQYYQAKQ